MWGRSTKFYNIDSYNQAKSAYNHTKPLRGWAADADRPLDKRSENASQWIHKRGEDYVVRLYRTDIVTYRADGSVLLNHGGWRTVSTATCMSASSPFACWCQGGELVVRIDGMKFVCPSAGLEVRGDSRWSPVNPPVATQKKTRVRKDKAKELRKYFKQVPEYIKAFSAAFEGGEKTITGRCITKQELNEPLTDDDAVALAWNYVESKRFWTGAIYHSTIRNNPEGSVVGFWREVYRVFDVVEDYEVELPYGEVGK